MQKVLKNARSVLRSARLFAAAAAVALSGGIVTVADASLIATQSPLNTNLVAVGDSQQSQPQVVTPGDTFTFDIAGFNSAGTSGYILGASLSATFGTTQTYTAAGVNGQDYTIASSEVVGLTTTTDTFTVTTPTNFVTTTTVNGVKITQLQFDIGDANSGVSFGGVPNTVDYVLPITGNSQTGNILYGAANTSFTLAPAVTLTNGGNSLAAVEGVSDGTTAISTLAVHNFTFSITYNNVPTPEPTSIALLAPAGMMLVRRRRNS